MKYLLLLLCSALVTGRVLQSSSAFADKLEPSKEHPRLKSHTGVFYNSTLDKDNTWNDIYQVYPFTKSGADLFFRGVVIGFSIDSNRPNSCILQYNEIYYMTVSAEEVYYQWTSSQTDSYMFFKRVLDMFDSYKKIDLGCHFNDVLIQVRKNLTSVTWWQKSIWNQFSPTWFAFLQAFFLFIYGIFWHSPQEVGEIFGVLLRFFSERWLDEFNPNDLSYVAPMQEKLINIANEVDHWPQQNT